MSPTILTSITEISAATWNSIVDGNSLICRHEYLLAVEKSAINDCRYFYPVLYDEVGQIAAHACIYFISTELDTFARGLTKRAINRVRKWWKTFLVLQSVECGTPIALGTTISFRPGVDRAACLARIVDAIEEIARQIRVKVVLLRDFYDSQTPFYDRLQTRGYRRIHNLPGCHMQVSWKTFDEYVGSLRSEYSNKVRSRMKRFNSSGCSMELVQEFSALARDLARLWRNVYDRATEYRREILLADFFENIDSELGARSSVILARYDTTPVGFMLLLEDDNTLIPLFCGLDYEWSRKCAVYFNLFYKSVEVAIDRRLTEIDLGITTLVPKLELGATVVQLHMYMKHLNPVLNRIVPNLFEMMTPKAPCAARNVFNQTGAVSPAPLTQQTTSNEAA